MIATRAKWDFDVRFMAILWFLDNKIVNLGTIDFQMSLPMNIVK